MGGLPLNNRNCYLFFNGYYAVSVASQILCRYGINNRIVRAPVYLRDSCNFALLIDGADEQSCRELLETEKIYIEKKAYTERNV